MVLRTFGFLVLKSFGHLELWTIDPLGLLILWVLRSFGRLVFWTFGLFGFGPFGPGDFWAFFFWSFGTLVRRFLIGRAQEESERTS